MKHYKLVVVMKFQPEWEMPLGMQRNIENAWARALVLMEELKWGSVTIGDAEHGLLRVTDYRGTTRDFKTIQEAVHFICSGDPEFTDVLSTWVREGEAAQPPH